MDPNHFSRRRAAAVVTLATCWLLCSCQDSDDSRHLPAPTVASLSARNVQISWEPQSLNGATEPQIERQTAGGETVTLTPEVGRSTVLDYGLEPQSTYQYRLCVGAGRSDEDCSPWASATTSTGLFASSVDITVAHTAAEGHDDLLLFSVIDGENMFAYGAVVITDRTGKIVWEYVDNTDGLFNDAELLDDGTILFSQFGEIRQVDLFYQPVRRFVHSFPVNPGASEAFDPVTVTIDEYFHHDQEPFGSGDIISLVYSRRHDDQYDVDILGDGVLIFDYETGEQRWRIDLFDYYDYQQFLCDPCMATTFLAFGHDWTHANALWFDEANSHLYINIRNLDRILVVEYPSGAVVREIGDDGVTFSHSHDPQILADGSILVFDNGLHRPAGEDYSRAVQFREQPSGLEELWEYREQPDFFAYAYGDADRLDNGNTLITDGFNGRIVEVDQGGNKIWELQLGQAGLGIYKSQYIPAELFRRLAGLR